METPSPTPPRKGEGDSEDQAAHRPSRAKRFQDGVTTVDPVGRIIGNGHPLPYPCPRGKSRDPDNSGSPQGGGRDKEFPQDGGRFLEGRFLGNAFPAASLFGVIELDTALAEEL